MDQKRILHMIGSLEIGGSQAMVLNWYRAIDREKVQFDFIVDHPDRMALAETVKALGARIYTMPTFVGTNLFAVTQAWDRFFAEHPEYKVLHSHVRSYASVYLPIAKKHGLKTIIHSHSTSNGSGISSIVKQVLQYPLRYQADYLFGCSKEAGEWLFGKKATQKPNYYMIPNSVACKRFYFDTEQRRRIRAEMHIDEDAKVVGHIGRFHEAKNHAFLIDVFYAAHKKDNNLKLLLVGDGDLRQEIEQQCSRLGIAEHVFFAGAQTDVVPYYSAIDLFLFPSRWEGLPVSVVEAQAAGLNCLLSDTVTKDVCLTDLVEYLPLDLGAEQWADRVLARLPAERTGLAEEKKKQLDSFDSEIVTQKMQEFYLGS